MQRLVTRAAAVVLLLLLFGVFKTSAQCGTINFSPSVKIGCSPLVVKFTAKGAPAGSFYTWDFGSGNVPGADTIVKAFTVPGKYTITLKISLPGGGTCTIIKTDSITVLPTPTENIKVEPGKIICNGPREVKFTDLNTTGIVEREWIIDGVIYKNVSSVTHKFTSSGNKTVSLKVKNSVGCVGLFSDTKFIQILDSVPSDFCADMIVTDTGIQAIFTPDIKITGSRTIKKYEWSFPGGTPSSFVGKFPPVVKYPFIKTQPDYVIRNKVKLVVTTGEDCKYTVDRREFIQRYLQPNGANELLFGDSICMKDALPISNLGNNYGRNFFEYSALGANIDGPVMPSGLKLIYTKPGKYDIRFSFKYASSSCKTTVFHKGYINVLGPKVEFESPDAQGCDPQAKINLLNKSIVFGAPDIFYTWRIYDSTDKQIRVFGPTKTKDLVYTPNAYGKFGVSLTAKSSNRCFDSLFISKYINISNPTIVDIKTDTIAYCMGNGISLFSTTDPVDVGTQTGGDIYKYYWEMQLAQDTNKKYSEMGKIAIFRPLEPGDYNVTLKLANGDFCGDTLVKTSLFKVVGATASIKLDNVTGCTGLTSKATSKILRKHPDNPSNTISYLWQASPPDGVTIIDQTKQDCILQFNQSGTFTILLNLIDKEGCTTQVSENDLVKVGVSSLFEMPANECLGDTVDVEDNFSSLNAETYKWSVFPPDAAIMVPSDSVRNVKIIYKRDTCIKLQLETTRTINGKICSDITTDSLCIILPKAGFATKDTSLYCAPVVADFTVESSNATKFLWEFGDKTSVFNESKKISHVYFQNNMQGYDVKITAYDTNGCFESFQRNKLIKITGPEPKFIVDRKAGCDNAFVKFTNLSSNIKNFVLIYDDGTIIDSNTVEDHKYILEENGEDSMIFYPILLATDNTNCQAYFKDTITIYRSPKADFYLDTTVACVPYIARFKNASLRANKWWWDFNNDGIVDDTTENPKYVYNQPGFYSISLKVTNSGGCYDSVVFNNYINVEPIPRASFSATDKKFCGIGDVKFIDSSNQYAYYLFDYGDGSPLETSNTSPHKYFYREGIDAGDSVVFVPKLIAFNNAGCTDTCTDTIIVYAKPVTGFTSSTISGCAPLFVTFADTGKHNFITEWDFDNNGTIDTTGTLVTHTFGPGLYTVKQRITGLSGCKDSAIKVSHIKLNEPPVADFSISDTIVCYGQKVNFADASTPKANLRTWKWFFDEPETLEDTSELQNPEFTFYTAGYRKIIFAVTDNEGCTDTIEKLVFVEDTLQPINCKLHFVSVEDDGKIKVSWNKNTVYDFEEYNLERSGDASAEIYTSKHFSDTAYMDEDAILSTSTKSYCYTLTTKDACGNISAPAITHCTILLKTSATGSGRVQLDWSAYAGWPQVKEYRIYRALGINAFAQIGTVSHNVLKFTDSTLCDEDYCFYVEAVDQQSVYFSKSNKSCIHPQYTFLSIPANLQYATVENNASVKLKWETFPGDSSTAYVIDRFTKTDGWKNGYARISDTFYNDINTNVSENSYVYRIRSEDACGYFGPYSNPATSILLKANVTDDKVILRWNKYHIWKQGVKEYELQIRKRNGEFATVNKILYSDSVYVDDSVYAEIDTSYCYRIIAHEEGFYPTNSTSNLACVTLSPRIYVPNAFSPNDDKINDVWKVSAVSIYNRVGSDLKDYNVRIYDRWGSLVFQSNDVYEGWDGSVNGKTLPIGVFVYIIKAQGINGNNINIRGIINLVK